MISTQEVQELVDLAAIPDRVASKIAMSQDPLTAGCRKSERIAGELEKLKVFAHLDLCFRLHRASENRLYLSDLVDVRAKLIAAYA